MAESVYLSLGANLGDRAGTLRRAIEECGRIEGTRVEGVSGLWATEPVGYAEQPEFLNCAAHLLTELEPIALLDRLREIELRLGRVARRKWHEREIDIDIVFFGDRVIDGERLRVPHPEMRRRRFVLAPLAEIAPEARHPLLELTVAELLEICPDPARVERVAPAIAPLE